MDNKQTVKIIKSYKKKPLGTYYLAKVTIYIDGKQATIKIGRGCETFSEVELVTNTTTEIASFMSKCLGHNLTEESEYE